MLARPKSRSTRVVLLVALVSLLAGACTRLAPSANAPSSQASTDAAWRAELIVSGGFAGFDQRFSVDSQAATLTAADRRRERTASRNLTPSQIAELTDLLATPASAESAATPLNARCADCLRYTLSITGRAAAHRADYDSSTLPGSPDAALIQRLIELGRETLAEQRH